MNFLLDVNALIALGYRNHVFHSRVAKWARGKPLFTCSISELGFVRVLTSLPETDVSVATCVHLLSSMKEERWMQQIPDNRSAVHLPAWVEKPKQTTDGHLAELARASRALLATLDERIPGAILIPG